MARSDDMQNTGEYPVRTLRAIVDHARDVEGVRKADLSLGDWVVVKTRNSTYSLRFLGGELYAASGGWFDRHGPAPHHVTITGCTWGGTAIKHDLIAAPGLFLEFGNQVKTTRIREVQVIRAQESPHLQ
ncbi:MAG: hypothetical protein PVF68_02740 [Acidobacteriota bacterium]